MIRTRVFRPAALLAPICAVAALMVASPAASADPTCTINWDGGAVNGNWSTPENWDTNVAPAADDVVCVDGDSASTPVTVSAAVSVAQVISTRTISIGYGGEVTFNNPLATSTFTSLTVNGGTITGPGSQTIEPGGVFNWNDGYLIGDGTTTFSVGSTANLAFPRITGIYGRLGGTRKIVNNGTAIDSGNGMAAIDGTPQITNNGSFRFANYSGLGGSSSQLFVNNGTIIKDEAGNSTLGWQLENNGIVDARDGDMTFTGGGVDSARPGVFKTAATGANIHLTGLSGNHPFKLSGGPQLDGNIMVESSTLDLQGDVTAAGSTHVLASGTLTGPGNLTQSGQLQVYGGTISGSGNQTVASGGVFDWNDGYLLGSGSTTIAPGATGAINFLTVPFFYGRMGDTRKFVNNGSTTLSPGAIASISGTPQIINTGTFEISGNTNISKSGGSPSFVNSGTLVKSSGGTSYVSWALDNSGTIDSQSGLVDFNGGGVDTARAGVFKSTSGAGRIQLGGDAGAVPFKLSSGSSFVGDIEVINGGTLDLDGAVNTSGSLKLLDYSKVTGSGDLLVGGQLQLFGGAIDGNGTQTILPGGYFDWIDGEMLGSGTTYVSDGATMVLWVPAWYYSSDMEGTRRLVNSGTLNLLAGSIYARSGGSRPVIRNYGTINFSGGGLSAGAGAEPRLVNAGTVVSNGGQDYWRTENDGILRLHSGVLNTSDFRTTWDGEVVTEIRGITAGQDYGYLATDTASLNGHLRTELHDGFEPVEGDVVAPLRYNSRNGEFSQFDDVDAGNGLVFGHDYAATALNLTVGTPPAAAGFSSPSGGFSARSFGAPSGPGNSGAPQTFAMPGDSPAVDSAQISPELTVHANVDKADSLPGDELDYTGTVTNSGSTLNLHGMISSTPIADESSVTSYLAFVEYRSPSSGEWQPLAGVSNAAAGITPEYVPPIDSGMTITASGQTVGGVTYPASGDGLLGTTVPAGATAQWSYDASVALTASQSAFLTDPSNASDVRLVYRVENGHEIPNCAHPVLTGTTSRFAFGPLFSTQTGTAIDVSLAINGPGSSAQTFDETTDPELAALAPGESFTKHVHTTLESVNQKGANESDDDYLARLAAADGAEHSAMVQASGSVQDPSTGDDAPGTSPIDATPDSATSTEHVPAVHIDKTGPAMLNAGDTAVYEIALQNTGGAPADIAVSDKDDDGATIPVTGAPAQIDSNDTAGGQSTVEVAATHAEGQIGDTATVTWTDSGGHAYGPISDHVTTQILVPGDGQPQAPEIEGGSQAPSFFDQTSFLFEGPDAIQQGVEPGAIEPARESVIRGRILDTDGAPLQGVKVQVVDHEEYGTSFSRSTGDVYMAVNGGGEMTVSFSKDGYLSSQRTLTPDWRDYTWLGDDVALVKLDDKVTDVSFDNAAGPGQFISANAETDSSGTRRATLFFQPGTTANAQFADGTETPLSDAHVRATEITVGPNGREAMPAALPPSSMYTYAVAYTSDEALAMGAEHVAFDKPVITYNENFLHFRVGDNVPNGYLDEDKGVWMPQDSGRVVKILSESGGLAELDVDGSGTPASAAQRSALDITDAELTHLATAYDAGDELWRVPINHFSNHMQMARGQKDRWGNEIMHGAYDKNGSGGVGSGATYPKPKGGGGGNCKTTTKTNSVVECESQTYGENIHMPGVPFDLYYSSDRVPGHTADNEIRVPLTDGTPPQPLKRVRVSIDVAGRDEDYTFDPGANQDFTFKWDGDDAFGRKLTGSHKATVRLGYVYPMVYGPTARFGEQVADAGDWSVPNASPNYYFSADDYRGEVTLWTQYDADVASYDTRKLGTGGWTLGPVNFFDQASGKIYRGDGSSTAISPIQLQTAHVWAGSGDRGFGGDGGNAIDASFNRPRAMAMAPDGAVYVADTENNRIRLIAADGTVSTVAGTGVYGFSGDGGPATSAQFANPTAIASGPGGELYVADTNNNRIRKIAADGTVSTVAGGGTRTDLTVSTPATEVRLGQPSGLAVAAWGDIYISDTNHNSVRRVAADGTMTTIAGNGTPGFNGDGILGTHRRVNAPAGLAVDADGNVYVADAGNDRVRRVRPTGSIETFAGGGSTLGDGRQAAAAGLAEPTSVALSPDGRIYIADRGHSRLRVVGEDGVIGTAAGNGTDPHGRGPATGWGFNDPLATVVSPDNKAYVLDAGAQKIVEIGFLGKSFTQSDVLIPAPGGGEVYQFNAEGRQLRTLDAKSGATIYQFGYDDEGRVTSITDASGNVTTIEHDGSGNPRAIVGPYGQRTELSVDGDGYLNAAAIPGGGTFAIGYGNGGLLSSFKRPGSPPTQVHFDDTGLLTSDSDASGSGLSLHRENLSDGRRITVTTAEGRETVVRLQDLAAGSRRTITAPDGLDTVTESNSDGNKTVTLEDGSVSKSHSTGNPRFGMLAPFNSDLEMKTPAGLEAHVTQSRSTTGTSQSDPLQISSETNTHSVNGRTSVSVYNKTSNHTDLNSEAGSVTQTSAAGRTSTLKVNAQGEPISASVAGMQNLTYSYDSRGRLASYSFGSRTTSIEYDAHGNVARTTDPLGSQTTYSYDDAGNLTSETLPGGRTAEFTYDLNGNVLSVKPPARPAHSFTYTLASLLAGASAPQIGSEPASTAYEYDRDRSLTKITRPSGAAASYSYDSAGRLDNVHAPEGDSSLAYDPSTGNLKTATSPTGEQQTFSYDGPLPTGSTLTGEVSGHTGVSYDNDLRAASISAGGDQFQLSYDADSLLIGAGDETLEHSANNGLLTDVTLGNLATSTTYNQFAEPSARDTALPGGGRFKESYDRDQSGRITAKTVITLTSTTDWGYSYDLSGRLTTVTKNGAPYSSYAYDANGNRTSITDSSGQSPTTQSAAFDTRDRMTSQGDLALSYNANGELTAKTNSVTGANTSFRYGTLGELTGATTPSGKQISYLYDAQGNRVGKKEDGTLTQGLLYAPGLTSPVAELDGSNARQATFTYGSSSVTPDYMKKGGHTYRLLTDQLGSVRMVVDAQSGSVAQEIEYGAFGEVLSDSNPGFQPFGFAGGLYDSDTGLTHFGAREYDAGIGRWTSSDPISFAGEDTNLYGYVLGDPINLVDSSGLRSNPMMSGPQLKPAPESPGMQGVCKVYSGAFGLAFSYTKCTWTDFFGNSYTTKTYEGGVGTPNISYTKGLGQTNASNASQLCGGFASVGAGAGIIAGESGTGAAGHDSNGNPIIVNVTGPSLGFPPGPSASAGYGWTKGGSCGC